ncbi:MAG: tetratricopeptide repeat protein [Treponema sp.]|jgi:tetratricopeptide (TPR) repeat protein|nr:tetratricopeptide repeat protein [Treponema sp.]
MYSKRTRYNYRSYIRRKRLIFSVIALAVIGLLSAAVIQFAGKITGAARGERRELVQFWEAGSYNEVYNRSQAALAARPLDYFLLTMHGFSAYQLGISQINSLNAERYFDDCVRSLRKALLLKNSLNDGRLYYVLGKAYNYRDENYADLAVKYLEKAGGLSYNAADIPEYLGLAYAAVGDYRNSVTAFAEALVIQNRGNNGPPDEWSSGERPSDERPSGERPSGLLLLSIARSYFALDEFEQARAYLQRCVEVSPDSRIVFSARLLLSDVLQKTGDNNGAKQQLLDILGEAGENAEAHYQLGELYALQGEATRARAEWRLALRADPAHLKARTRLSM